MSVSILEKNNLAESVTFIAATVIGFLLSINITYFKYNIYKARGQGEYSVLGREIYGEI